jgi:hypothetical protein
MRIIRTISKRNPHVKVVQCESIDASNNFCLLDILLFQPRGILNEKSFVIKILDEGSVGWYEVGLLFFLHL